MNLESIDAASLPPAERAVVEEFLRRRALRRKGGSFLDYVQHVAPWFVIEEVHCLIAQHFERLRARQIDRLMIMMPPRTGKSEMTSKFLPSWWMGHFPGDKLLHVSYATTLVEKFGRNIRNMLLDDAYQDIFPDIAVAKDSRAAAQWATTAGGEYNALGVGSGAAGKGGNLILVDDPMSEQDMFSKSTMDGVYEYYGAGLYSRRQPDRNAFVITMTRWNVGDLIGRLLADAATKPDADQWVTLKIPAVLDEASAALLNTCSNDPHITTPHFYQAGDSFSPRRWPLHELTRTKNTVSRKAWASLYLQSPVEDGGGILKREWWKPWRQEHMPKFEYVLQSYDTAFEDTRSSDYSARTTFGVFRRAADGRMCVLILERMKKRMEFPALLEAALDSYKEYSPDRVVIEKAASGAPLIQELRKRGIPVAPIKPVGSKIARAHAATILLEQGVVYYPDRRWADELIDECTEFPNGAHDDSVDSLVHGLNYLRRTFMVETPADLEDEDDDDELDAQTKRSYAVRRSRLSVAA